MVTVHSDSERGNLYRHMGYSFRLAARVLLYAPSYRQDSYISLLHSIDTENIHAHQTPHKTHTRTHAL